MAIVTAMSEPTRSEKLIEIALGEPVAEFVAQRRPDMSWRTLAKEITSRTGESITGETLRQWMDGRLAVEVKVVPAEAASRPPSKPSTGSPPSKPPQPKPQTQRPKVDAGASA